MPKPIKIGNKKFEIEEREFLTDDKDRKGKVLGRIYHQNQLILLKKKMPNKELKKHTLFHEITHSILRQLSQKEYKGLFFTPNYKLFKLSNNEEVVEELAILLRKTFKLKNVKTNKNPHNKD